MTEALLLLQVEPRLKGVLLATRAAPRQVGRTVHVPLHVTEDRLLGGIEFAQTVRTGKRICYPGLLAEAHNGYLSVSQINLLDPRLACQIAQALDTSEVRVERDGITARYPSAFSLIATYDPREGVPVSSAIADAVGIHVVENGTPSLEERVERLRNHGKDASESGGLKERVTAARSLLPSVEIGGEDIRFLIETALQCGVQGHRADLFSVRLARAHAALNGRSVVAEEDLEAAVRLVIEPRRRTSGQPSQAPAERQQEGRHEGRPGDQEIDVPVVDCEPPAHALESPGNETRVHTRADQGRRRSQGEGAFNQRRGRYVRAVPANGKGGSVALEATLRAAAPFQKQRRLGRKDRAVQLTADDLRFKQFKQDPGILAIFAVDTSGSMAHNRIGHAKGALIRVLREAYLRRDKIALIGFHGQDAETLLPPTRSVELARRAVEGMRVGGGTPLAAALKEAVDVARRARFSGIERSLLVLFTDGRANVSLAGTQANDIWREVGGICGTVRREGMKSLVVDTTARHLSGGAAERLAALLGGRHARLPLRDSGAAYGIIAGMADAMRRIG